MNNYIQYFKSLPSKSILKLIPVSNNYTIPRYFVYYATIDYDIVNDTEDNSEDNSVSIIGWLYDSDIQATTQMENESINANKSLEIYSDQIRIVTEMGDNIEIFVEEYMLSENNHKIYRSLKQSEFNEFCESDAKWLYTHTDSEFTRLDLNQFRIDYEEDFDSNSNTEVYYPHGGECDDSIYCDQTDYNNVFVSL